jgi:hypothetical protein
MRPCALVCLIVSVLAFGCQEPDRAPEAPRAVEDVYGLSLTLDLRDASGAEEYYTVDRDGLLGFGGGLDARFERVSYEAMLTADDMQALQRLIDEQELLDSPLTSSNQPKDVRYSVKIRTREDSINKNLKGENARLEAMRAQLKQFANRRLTPELERQPRPSAGTQPAATQPR